MYICFTETVGIDKMMTNVTQIEKSKRKRPRHPPGPLRKHKHRAGKRMRMKKLLKLMADTNLNDI